MDSGSSFALRYKTFVNGILIYSSNSIYGTNIVSGTTAIPKASELDRAAYYFCYGFNGEFSFDNMSAYHSDKTR